MSRATEMSAPTPLGIAGSSVDRSTETAGLKNELHICRGPQLVQYLSRIVISRIVISRIVISRIVIVGIAVAALAVSACSSALVTSVNSTRMALASVVQRTVDADSAKFAMRMSIDFGDFGDLDGFGMLSSIEFAIDGEMDFANESGTMTMAIPDFGIGASSGDLEIRFIGTKMYMKMPTELRPPGVDTDWVEFDLTAVTGLGGIDPSDFSGGLGMTDPTEFLDQLAEVSDSLVESGTAEIRGVQTTGYTVEFSMADAMAQFGDTASAYGAIGTEDLTIPMNVYVDGEDRLRRVSIVIDFADLMPSVDDAGLSADELGQFDASMSMTVDYYDFGIAIDVEPPPAADTTDITELYVNGAAATF